MKRKETSDGAAGRWSRKRSKRIKKSERKLRKDSPAEYVRGFSVNFTNTVRQDMGIAKGAPLTVQMMVNKYQSADQFISAFSSDRRSRHKAEQLFTLWDTLQGPPQDPTVAASTGPPVEALTANGVRQQQAGQTDASQVNDATQMPAKLATSALEVEFSDPVAAHRQMAVNPNYAADEVVTLRNERAVEVGASNASLLNANSISALPAAARTSNDARNVREAMPPQMEKRHEAETLENANDIPEGSANIASERKQRGGGRRPGMSGEEKSQLRKLLHSGHSGDIFELMEKFASGQRVEERKAADSTTKKSIYEMFAAMMNAGQKDVDGDEEPPLRVVPDVARTRRRARAEEVAKTAFEREDPMGEGDLAPFLAEATSRDVEMSVGDPNFKRVNQATFTGWKPTNWPNGNVDNPMYMENQYRQDRIVWREPLSVLPNRNAGGTAAGLIIPSSGPMRSVVPMVSVKDDINMMSGLKERYNLCSGRGYVDQLQRNVREEAADVWQNMVRNDPLFIYNPAVEGVQVPQLAGREIFNPLAATEWEPMLRTGADRPFNFPDNRPAEYQFVPIQIGEADRWFSQSVPQGADHRYNRYANKPGLW